MAEIFAPVVIVAHIIIIVVLIGLILLQRSEGGALGIGGGGGGLMSGRSSGNTLTKVTTALAIGFFVTSFALAMFARFDASVDPVMDVNLPQGSDGQTGNPISGDGQGLLRQLEQQSGQTLDSAEPIVPSSE